MLRLTHDYLLVLYHFLQKLMKYFESIRNGTWEDPESEEDEEVDVTNEEMAETYGLFLNLLRSYVRTRYARSHGTMLYIRENC